MMSFVQDLNYCSFGMWQWGNVFESADSRERPLLLSNIMEGPLFQLSSWCLWIQFSGVWQKLSTNGDPEFVVQENADRLGWCHSSHVKSKAVLSSLRTWTNIQVPRCLREAKEVVTKRVVTFVDASLQAYGTAVYLQCVYSNGNTRNWLIRSKCKVAL